MIVTSRGVRIAIVLFAIAIFGFHILVTSGTTNTHAQLSSSIPDEGDIITDELRHFHLNFTSELEQINEVSLQTIDGTEIKYADLENVPRNTIHLELTESLAEGEYAFYWDVLDSDGLTVTGEIPYQVAVEGSNLAAGKQQTLIYVAIILLVVSMIVGLIVLRAEKK